MGSITPPPTTAALPLKDRRIFVIEDNTGNLSVISAFLRSRGALLVYDRWGDDRTLTKLGSELPIDLILLDLNLPGGRSGFDLHGRIRTLPGFEKIPIVLVTASGDSVTKNRARDMGFDGFISKPILFSDTFVRHVIDILSGNKVWL